MTRIIKTTQGTAAFVQTEEFADEADAGVGDNPETKEFKITNKGNISLFFMFLYK